MDDSEQLLAVMRDAALDGNAPVVAQLSAELAALLGVSEVGVDGHGCWLRLEVGGNSHRMRYLWPGRSLMGSPETERGRMAWETQRMVEISRGYWLGEVPVTQALWYSVTGESPSEFRSEDRPVERVSWSECQAFCRQLGESFPALHPRLPTEAEWEYAARAGTETATYNGEILVEGDRAATLDPIAWYFGNSHEDFGLQWQGRGTHPVALKRPNAWGCYDMLGNVSEWCTDVAVGAGRAGQGWRVFRGGSWRDDARLVRASYRNARASDYRRNDIGFRLACLGSERGL